MILVFYGSDRERVLGKIKSIEDSFYKKAGVRAPVFRFDGDNLNTEDFEHTLRAESMFGEKRLILARDIFSDKETVDEVLKIAGRRFASGVTAVIYENKLNKELTKKLEKIGAKLQEYKNTATSGKSDSKWNSRSIFQLSDMLLSKNRYGAFAAYHRARFEGLTPENIFWGIYRQFKNMLMLSSVSSMAPDGIQKETGLHPYVIKKGLGFLRNFDKSELEKKFERLMFLWSDAILGQRDLSADLELFILRP